MFCCYTTFTQKLLKMQSQLLGISLIITITFFGNAASETYGTTPTTTIPQTTTPPYNSQLFMQNPLQNPPQNPLQNPSYTNPPTNGNIPPECQGQQQMSDTCKALFSIYNAYTSCKNVVDLISAAVQNNSGYIDDLQLLTYRVTFHQCKNIINMYEYYTKNYNPSQSGYGNSSLPSWMNSLTTNPTSTTPTPTTTLPTTTKPSNPYYGQ